MIDAHQHFWHPGRDDYGWLTAENKVLFRPYGPGELAPQMEAVGVRQTITVQAAPTVEETEYVLGIADATPSVAGVVGWIDFEDKGNRAHLERLAKHPKFKGVRPMIQDIPDPDWMLRDVVQWAYQAIVDLDLTFDALGFPIHLDNFLTLFTKYPDMRVVIDHCMKPEIAKGPETGLANWAEGMRRLADETGAFCKLSGLITEDGEDWSVERLRRYVDHVLDCFGPSRIMWGSDWPVCRLRGEHGDWFVAARALTSHLDPSDQRRVFGGSAQEFYRIPSARL
jgi:L-fuconolactonase